MGMKAGKEIEYLKEISGISEFTIKGSKFLLQEECEDGANVLYRLLTGRFKISDRFLKIATKNESVLDDAVVQFNKKIDSLESLESIVTSCYHLLMKFSYGVVVKGDEVKNQRINWHNQILPLYLVPIMVRLSFDVNDVDEEEGFEAWKCKVKDNGPDIEFFIADKPFVPQELFDYRIEADWQSKDSGDVYLQLFDIDRADEFQSSILELFKNENSKNFPLIEKADKSIKDYEWLESLDV